MPARFTFNKLLRVIGILVLSNSVCSANADADQYRSEAKKLSLIDKAAEQWKNITRFRIEYNATPSPSNSIQASPVHRILAAAMPGELWELSCHFTDLVPWQVDPFGQELFIHKGLLCHQWIFNRIYAEDTIGKGHGLPGSAPANILYPLLPMWLLTDYRSPTASKAGIPFIPIEAVRSSMFRLLARSEVINGERCAIFDANGNERIWIAIDKGLCVMRRDYRDIQTGRLIQKIIVDKIDQVAPGLWLAKDFRRQVFVAGLGTNEDAMVQESKVHILRCDLNENVPYSIFVPAHPAGSVRVANGNQFVQISEGEDLLSDAVDFMMKYEHLPTKPISCSHPYLWLIAGLASGLLGVLFFFQKGKSHFEK